MAGVLQDLAFGQPISTPLSADTLCHHGLRMMRTRLLCVRPVSCHTQLDGLVQQQEELQQQRLEQGATAAGAMAAGKQQPEQEQQWLSAALATAQVEIDLSWWLAVVRGVLAH